MAITARHTLLTGSWDADVTSMERAIGRFKSDDRSKNACQVVFFEIVRDGHLHCNVTHTHPTKAVRGWAGPAAVAGGFVHNRTFANMSPSRMLRQIKDMVLAPRI
jgi:hypothetical protein